MLKFTRVPRPAAGNPLMRAVTSSVIYMTLCGLYIVSSGRIAAALARSVGELRTIETLKGLLFIVITGLLFFLISYARWRRIARQETQIVAQEKSLLQAERRSIAAVCTSTLAHDLNNLLMSLTGLVGNLTVCNDRESTPAALRQELEAIIGRLSAATRRLSSASSGFLCEDGTIPTDLGGAISTIVSLARQHPDVRACTLSFIPPPPVTATLSREMLEDAVMNLVVNAAQATGPGGRVELRLLQEPGETVLEVHDDGPGVPEDVREQIFTPCFTTKPEGTGIGLVSVRAFTDSFGGRITVGTSPLGGALFRICIPLESSMVA
jgi:signal transduction histidine kinase